MTIDKILFAARSRDARVTTSDEHVDHRWVPAEDVAGELYWESNRRTWQMVRHAVGLVDDVG